MATFKDILVLVDKVTDPLKKIQKNFQKTEQSTKKAEDAIKRFNKTAEKLKKVGSKMQSIGNKMTIGLTVPIVALGTAAIKSQADIEAMQQQLSTMLQSEVKGAEMFKKITEMASKTPFGTKDLMAATNTMLGFGIAEEKVLPLMQQLGDISGGNAERFRSLSLAFSQVSSAGKLQGQDLMQMINAGFNPLEAISKRTGKSIGQLKDEMSKGAITVKMVEQAMRDATSEGGRFYKMMDKQSKTALGQWSTMQDNLNMALAEFGKQIMPYAIKALQTFSKFLEGLNKLSPGTKKVLIILGGIIAIAGPLVSFVGTLTTVIGGLNVAMAFLAANPIVLTIAAWTAGIAAVVAIVVLLIKNWSKLVNWVKSGLRWISELVDKLGFLAYIIPGLQNIKLAKDFAKFVGGKIDKSKNDNSVKTFHNSYNTKYDYSHITNNNYNLTPLKNQVYSM